MEQIQVQTQGNLHAALHAAAKELSAALDSLHIRHCFIGGCAVSLLGGQRTTEDLDVIVDAVPADVREALLRDRERFRMTTSNKLVIKVGSHGPEFAVELLRGGSDQQLKLPNASSVPVEQISLHDVWEGYGDRKVPIVHPSVLVLTKIKRWMHIAESTRPKSISKAASDLEDIRVILRWLSARNTLINFDAHPEKPKAEILPGIRMLYAKDPEAQTLLEATMEGEDFALVKD